MQKVIVPDAHERILDAISDMVRPYLGQNVEGQTEAFRKLVSVANLLYNGQNQMYVRSGS